jgi:hypothetical protein
MHGTVVSAADGSVEEVEEVEVSDDSVGPLGSDDSVGPLGSDDSVGASGLTMLVSGATSVVLDFAGSLVVEAGAVVSLVAQTWVSVEPSRVTTVVPERRVEPGGAGVSDDDVAPHAAIAATRPPASSASIARRIGLVSVGRLTSADSSGASRDRDRGVEHRDARAVDFCADADSRGTS